MERERKNLHYCQIQTTATSLWKATNSAQYRHDGSFVSLGEKTKQKNINRRKKKRHSNLRKVA